MLAKNGLISSVGTKVSSRSLKMGGEFFVAMVRVSAFGSNWVPGAEINGIYVPTKLELAVACGVHIVVQCVRTRRLVFGVCEAIKIYLAPDRPLFASRRHLPLPRQVSRR